METKTVFFVGKPGCGKGTQADLLAKATGWPVVSTSSGLRALVAEDGAVGRKLQETMDSGILTPYWMASYVYLKSLFATSENGAVIFDGTGRTLPEAHIVHDSLLWIGKQFVIFHLKVSDEEVKKRIELRKATAGRADDHMVDKRLEEYYANTGPAIDYYRETGILMEIDGERSPEAIAEEVRRILDI